MYSKLFDPLIMITITKLLLFYRKVLITNRNNNQTVKKPFFENALNGNAVTVFSSFLHK